MPTSEYHGALQAHLDDLKSSNDALANNTAFVVCCYLTAIVPWAILAAIDIVNGRWRPIRDLYFWTAVQAAFVVLSVGLLLWYIVVQFIADDIKEAMAAIAVLLAAYFPTSRVLRQLWIIFAARSFSDIVREVPDLRPEEPSEGESPRRERVARRYRRRLGRDRNLKEHQLCNSSHFFDNDSPGDGVSGMGVRSWLIGTVVSWLAGRKLSVRPPAETAFDRDDMIESHRYNYAMIIARHRLRIIDCNACPEPTEDSITRLAWMYGNSFDTNIENRLRPFRCNPSLKIIHLGLLVHIGSSVLSRMWLESAGRERSHNIPLDEMTATQVRAHALFSSEKLYGLSPFIWFSPFLGESPQFDMLCQVHGLNGYHTPGYSQWASDHAAGIVPTTGGAVQYSVEDYNEAHLKLPVKSGTSTEHIFHGFRWEHTAEMITSTLELHALKVALFGNGNIVETGNYLANTVWTYVYVSAVLTRYNYHRKRKLFGASEGRHVSHCQSGASGLLAEYRKAEKPGSFSAGEGSYPEERISALLNGNDNLIVKALLFDLFP